ncbi:PAS domain-containing protein [Salmonella enterica subsp. arizonae]|uniref:PAS domain-containing protein n=1 Tax=Salmonella enterica subsp. arizonae TaxID=59203 RepID=A0A379SKH8_SALER|nr:PAS domain-containing protein [Salmonella enterica subsp. arizonae]
MINEHNCQLTEVVSQADIACYAAKNSGRSRLTVYEPQDVLTRQGNDGRWKNSGA